MTNAFGANDDYWLEFEMKIYYENKMIFAIENCTIYTDNQQV